LERALSLLAVFALPLALGLLHLRAYPELSPYDEATHADYVLTVLQGNLLRPGDVISQPVMREAACRGADLEGLVLPPCVPGAKYEPSDFPGGGRNYLYHHPPAYYGITAIVVRLMRFVGVDGLFEAARLASMLWVGAGLAVMWEVGRRLEIPLLLRNAGVVLVAASEPVLYTAATVTNDATAYLAGAAVLLATLRWDSKGRGLTMLALAAGGAVLLKNTNAIAVLGVMLYLALRWLQRERGPLGDHRARGYLAAIASLSVGSLSVMIGWLLVRPTPGAFIEPAFQQFAEGSVGPGDVLAQSLALVTPLRAPLLPAFFDSPAIWVPLAVIDVAMVAACLVSVSYVRGGHIVPTVGLTTLVALPIGAIALVVSNLLFLGLYFSLPPRYGLSAMPALGLALAWFFGSVSASRVFVAIVMAVFGSLVVHLIPAAL
jgi:hypothetical protein